MCICTHLHFFYTLLVLMHFCPLYYLLKVYIKQKNLSSYHTSVSNKTQSLLDLSVNSTILSLITACKFEQYNQ